MRRRSCSTWLRRRREHVTMRGGYQWLGGPPAGDQWRCRPVAGLATPGRGYGRRRACAGGREEDSRSLKPADGTVHVRSFSVTRLCNFIKHFFFPRVVFHNYIIYCRSGFFFAKGFFFFFIPNFIVLLRFRSYIRRIPVQHTYCNYTYSSTTDRKWCETLIVYNTVYANECDSGRRRRRI